MRARRTHEVHEDDPHDHDRGLSFDVSTLMNRRRALGLFAVSGLTVVAGCGSSSSGSATTSAATTASTTTGTTGTTGSVTDEIPEETGGPFPADGSNGVNVLTESGIVRSDIRASFGSASGVAAGVPLAINLTILDVAKGGAPVEGAAVYLWHCDRDGRYSLYDSDISEENYLRGVQVADASGVVAFRSIYPAAYSGRWPHIHFEVSPDAGYEQSLGNLAQSSLDTDNVFGDGYSTQLGTVSGTAAKGMAVSLNVGV